jgi:hypothetical protein
MGLAALANFTRSRKYEGRAFRRKEMSKKIAKGDYWKVVTVGAGWGTDGEEYYSAHVNRPEGRLQYFQRKYTRATPGFAERGYYPLVFTTERAASHFCEEIIGSHYGRVFKCRCRGKIVPIEALPMAYLGKDLVLLLVNIIEGHWGQQARWWGVHVAMAEEVMLLDEVKS